MKKQPLLFYLFIPALFFTSCRFTIEPVDYIGTYKGTYSDSNLPQIPNKGDGILQIIDVGNHQVNLIFTIPGDTSLFFYNWPVKRESAGLAGSAAYMYDPGLGGAASVWKLDHSVNFDMHGAVSISFYGNPQ